MTDQARELLSNIFNTYIGTGDYDSMYYEILEHFEPKRKRLKVRISENPPLVSDGGYTIALAMSENGYTFFMSRFDTKQEALEFCTKYGLEVVE